MTKEQWIAFLESVSVYDLSNIIAGLEDGALSVESAAEQLALLSASFVMTAS